jgi:putative methionine-R-sulfoxide reductase with GAF domain
MRSPIRFPTISIRRSITLALIVLGLLVLLMAAFSYVQLRQVAPYSDEIIRSSSDMAQLQSLAIATSALDADLERYLVIRGVEYREAVEQDLLAMTVALAALQSNPTMDTWADFGALEAAIGSLQEGAQVVLGAESANASSGDINRSIVQVYNDIEAATQAQAALSATTMTRLQGTAQYQSLIANSVLTQWSIFAAFVVLIALITALVTDRRLRAISTLTETATAIAAGDIDREAPVERQDEIGKLATAFNAMTRQLRDLIGSLEQRVAERTKALSTASEVSRRLSTWLDEQQLVREVVELVQSSFDYYHAHIYLVDPATADLVMAGGTGEAGQRMMERGHRIHVGAGLVGRAAETNKPVLVPDVSKDPQWLPNPLLPFTKSEVAVPIAIGDEVLGVLDVQHHVSDGLRQQDADMLQAIANQTALALRNARSYTDIRKRAERESLIAAIGQKIEQTASVESALKVAVRELGQALRSQTSVQLKSADGGKAG